MQIFELYSDIETPILTKWIGCLPRFKFKKAFFMTLLIEGAVRIRGADEHIIGLPVPY